MAPPWGNPSSTLDWCEENYQVTWLVAEFWNTVSNLMMIVPAIYGIQQARKQGLEHRFVMVNALFLAVGIGSALFHMTLRWEMQLLDEVPMVWGTSYMIYCMHIVLVRGKDKSGVKGAVMLLYSLTFTVLYILLQKPIIHQSMYGLLVFVLIYESVNLLNKQYNYEAMILYGTGFLLYLIGFILWNMDNHLCPGISWVRNSLPPLLQPLTQLHAWWHLLAGYATYLNILYAQHQRLTFLKRPVVVTSSWLGITVKPKRACQLG